MLDRDGNTDRGGRIIGIVTEFDNAMHSIRREWNTYIKQLPQDIQQFFTNLMQHLRNIPDRTRAQEIKLQVAERLFVLWQQNKVI